MQLHLALAVTLALVVAGCMGANPSNSTSSADNVLPHSGTKDTRTGTIPTYTATSQAMTTGTGGPPKMGPSCKGSGPVPLTTLPMALSDFSGLLPYGIVVGGHVTPIDHMYFQPADWPGHRDQYEVHAIANGTIVDIQTRPSTHAPGSNPDSVEYRIWIDHTCTFHSYVDLVTSLTPRLLKWYNATHLQHQDMGDLPITAGELMGHIGGQTLDFGVYNDEKTLTGFLVPAHYVRESWKIHTDDPFLYFTEPVRSQLLAKDVRFAEPRAGKIDYDVEGRAIGNWFQVGTNGYAGPDQMPSPPSGYWAGHLSLSPDAYLPTHLLVSLGDYAGEAHQFAVKGNAPDFATVSEASGLVKYELVQWGYKDGDDPSQLEINAPMHPIRNLMSLNHDGQVQGVLLVQLTGPRLLKVETFPGKTAADVPGFDGAAKTYER